MTKLKGKKIWLVIVAVIVLISIIYSSGSSSAKILLEEQKVTYDELSAAIEKKEKELETVQVKLDDVNKEFQEREQEFSDATKIIENKQAAEKEIGQLESVITDKNNEIARLGQEIQLKNEELIMVSGKVSEAIGQPINLTAGFHLVGKDIPAARYLVTPSRRDNGNFFVNGGSKVNILLGTSDIFVNEYAFDAENGDEIELSLAATFTPID